MAVLVRSGKLEAKGNINRWGYSEVRLAALLSDPAAAQAGAAAPRGGAAEEEAV